MQHDPKNHSHGHSHEHSHEGHCHTPEGHWDKLLWGSLVLILLGFVCHYFVPSGTLPQSVHSGAHTVVDLMQKMAWGLVLALAVVGLMDFVPRAKFHQVLGPGEGLSGVFRATLAGVLLDLCNHGILLVAMKLYERGASLGQVVAFLVASPWNSFSMTLILWSLIGLPLTLIFIVLSAVIALITGLVFQRLVATGVLPENPHQLDAPSVEDVPWFEFPEDIQSKNRILQVAKKSWADSQIILRWIFFGVVLTAVVKALVAPEVFQQYFGPDIVGVALTLLAATALEVCSEGSAPLASELVVTAKAPGNGFTFLMAGVSTDYTEIMAIKETTKSWRSALFLPLVTLPQIIVLGLLLNGSLF